jgi:hypothetical protein
MHGSVVGKEWQLLQWRNDKTAMYLTRAMHMTIDLPKDHNMWIRQIVPFVRLGRVRSLLRCIANGLVFPELPALKRTLRAFTLGNDNPLFLLII